MSSPKNACVGGYVSKKPIKKFEALFVHACQVWDVQPCINDSNLTKIILLND